MKKLKYILFAVGVQMQAQQIQIDSTPIRHITEVVVIGTAKVAAREAKPLGSIDEYLQQSAQVEMLRRGGYAWEPLINGMASERTLVTIDGMRIFGACTDKMDPITSYIEVSNLQQADISSGQSGACHGNTIGGSIDLKRSSLRPGKSRWTHQINTGFETVNQQKIFGAGTKYKNEKFYTDVNFMARDAENYRAGGNVEVLHSQFRKVNSSGLAGLQLDENKLLEASVIYDKATDVGYPALPMDVALAEAIITSLKFQMIPAHEKLKIWESKIYYNTVKHHMDDTQRQNVAIHMDMPGTTTTLGYYSHLKFDWKQHRFLLNLNGYYNKSYAEMTMYPQEEKPMFMLTWPDVKTLSQTLYLEDEMPLAKYSNLKWSASVTAHFNRIDSDLGLNSLQIFYPELGAERARLLTSVAANYIFDKGGWQAGVGAAYGNRAPSVSEGYGFYLFNSAENYDYVGNPNLKNESSIETNAFIGIKKKSFSAKLSSSYFHISDYIIGSIQKGLTPMTLGANGVKVYTALHAAHIFNVNLSGEIHISQPLVWTAQLSYARGTDSDGQQLPFMSPFSYRTALRYSQNRFSSQISLNGNARHSDFAEVYGEKPAAAFAVLNANIGYRFSAAKTKVTAKAGVENLFDTCYTTYSDWNQIPRPGRNLFMNLSFDL